jgi:sulfonate transport system permease protein
MSPRSRGLRGLVPWALPVALLAAWQAGAGAGWIAEEVLPAPTSVLAAFWELAAGGKLWEHIAVSGARALIGFSIGGGLGLAFGLLTGLSRLGERVFDTSVQMIRNIPHLALIPLVILWFGIEEEARVFLVALGTFFPIYVNTMHGVRSVDPQLMEMGRAYGMGRWTLFRRVVLPGALPSVLVGLRYALGIMWLTLIVAETIAANSGIGYLAMHAREFMMVDVVVLSILVYAALGKLADSTARALERRCLAWNPAYRSA